MGKALEKAQRRREIMERAVHLPHPDREFLTYLYARGVSARDLAILLNVSIPHVRRRAAALVRRLSSSEFRFVVASRGTWPVALADVATACIVEGKSMHQAAAALRRSFHDVRRARACVLQMARAQELKRHIKLEPATRSAGCARQEAAA